MEAVNPFQGRPILFLAEGVFMYLEAAQVRSLVQKLHRCFPGAELVFDAYSPLHAWVSNLQTAAFGLRIHWGIWQGQQLERWGSGIRTVLGLIASGELPAFDRSPKGSRRPTWAVRRGGRVALRPFCSHGFS